MPKKKKNQSILKEKETVKHNLVLDDDMVFLIYLIPFITMAKNINSMDL